MAHYLLRTAHATKTLDLRLIAISNCSQVADPLAVVEALIRGGISALMLREKGLDPQRLRLLAEPIAAVCRRHGVGLIINGSVNLALELEADAVHLGFGAPRAAVARAQVGDRLLIGVSAHRGDDLNELRNQGADYASLSPIFAPHSKRQVLEPLGPAYLNEASRCELPLVALGGIENGRIATCLSAGAVGVAAIGKLFGADDPQAAARSMRLALEAWTHAKDSSDPAP